MGNHIVRPTLNSKREGLVVRLLDHLGHSLSADILSGNATLLPGFLIPESSR